MTENGNHSRDDGEHWIKSTRFVEHFGGRNWQAEMNP
jgi:hypothetical protein